METGLSLACQCQPKSCYMTSMDKCIQYTNRISGKLIDRGGNWNCINQGKKLTKVKNFHLPLFGPIRNSNSRILFTQSRQSKEHRKEISRKSLQNCDVNLVEEETAHNLSEYRRPLNGPPQNLRTR